MKTKCNNVGMSAVKVELSLGRDSKSEGIHYFGTFLRRVIDLVLYSMTLASSENLSVLQDAWNCCTYIPSLSPSPAQIQDVSYGCITISKCDIFRALPW